MTEPGITHRQIGADATDAAGLVATDARWACETKAGSVLGAMSAPPARKPATDLLPPDVLLAVAGLLAESADKHAGRDINAPRPWSSDYAPLQRHLLAFWAGADTDPDSGRAQALHIAARALMLAASVLRHPDQDDRPRLTRPPTGPPDG